jgi:hypothetical protein
MKRASIGLIVGLILVGVWWLLRDRGESSASPVTSTSLQAGEAAAPAEGPAPAAPARADGWSPAPASPLASAPRGGPAGSDALAPGRDARAATGRPPPIPQGTDPARPRPALPPVAPSAAPADQLVDRTGWNDPSAVKQLNKEFMPLASECIEQARARKPHLRGRLVFAVSLAPTENGRSLVASIKLRPDNEITDPELLECIRESALALEGIKAPHDFDLTMPIGMDDPS